MTEPANIVLKSGADKRIKQGHLWVYSNEINVKESPLNQFEAGQQVRVVNSAGKAIATAMVSPNSLICARLISRDAQQFMDKSLLVHRVKIALSIREQLFDRPFYRLVYGDSDALPGLVIDRFDDKLVVQLSNAGMEALKAEIIEALNKVLNPEVIVFKNNGKMRQAEGLESYVEVAKGELTEVMLEENGVAFEVPVTEGQKTGWFYDHRMARSRLKSYVQGKRVLDVFSYIGGWGVQAAAFGAAEVVCVDSSALALEYVAKNAAHNDCSDKVKTIKSDALEALKELKAKGETFDVVILDPPALIPRRKDQKAGERAYQKLNQAAMRLLSKDGVLVSASCSMHLKKDRLTEIVRSVGSTLEKDLQLLESIGQVGDHPVHPSIAETEYLKSGFFRVLPRR